MTFHRPPLEKRQQVLCTPARTLEALEPGFQPNMAGYLFDSGHFPLNAVIHQYLGYKMM